MAARWTTTDDAALRSLYASGMSLRAIGEQLGRSYRSVDERRRTLEIAPRRRVRPWSATEDAILRAAAAAGLPDGVVALRFGRSDEQVRRRRREIVGPRTSPRAYGVDEDERLRACWVDGGDVERLARELGRTAGSVRLRAQSLGVHHPQLRPRWRTDEDTILRDGYEHALSCAQIAEQLPRRTVWAVAARAGKLGIATYARLWSPVDDQRLRVLSAEGLALVSIAQALGRTPHAVIVRARKLGVRLPQQGKASRAGRRWTAAEDQALRANAPLNPAVLARALGRSPAAVTQRLRRLGIGAKRSPHHPVVRRDALTPGEQVTAARELRAGGPRRVFVIAQRLNASPELIRAAAEQPARSRPLLGSGNALERQRDGGGDPVGGASRIGVSGTRCAGA